MNCFSHVLSSVSSCWSEWSHVCEPSAQKLGLTHARMGSEPLMIKPSSVKSEQVSSTTFFDPISSEKAVSWANFLRRPPSNTQLCGSLGHLLWPYSAAPSPSAPAASSPPCCTSSPPGTAACPAWPKDSRRPHRRLESWRWNLSSFL